MKPDAYIEGRRWLQQAEQDIDDAQYAMEGERYHLTCFLAQQAAEKAKKAFLYFQGEEMVWGHSVAELCTKASIFNKDFRNIKRTCAALDKYYIPIRYPNGLPGGVPYEAFEKNDAERAITLSTVIITMIKEKIGKN